MYVKFCDEEYDITKNCNTIKFGTLHEYRKKCESDIRKDPTEGKLEKIMRNMKIIDKKDTSKFDIPWNKNVKRYTITNSIDANIHIFRLILLSGT
ncbi:MAG: hypothetical protein R1F52_04450 [Candidatus Nitrosoabyssus spongiisocia]|nr:MAG: hypothetical protein R1F52_04450 [Nitrosopumilaceae archaeon AB1(1)]